MQEFICSQEEAVKKVHTPQKQMQVSMGVKKHFVLDFVQWDGLLGWAQLLFHKLLSSKLLLCFGFIYKHKSSFVFMKK